MAEDVQALQFASKRNICVWTLPQGPAPAVRVEIKTGRITTSRLLEVACNALGIHTNSRLFFGLFKGLDPPVKKFGDEETIYTPCQNIVSILKWSFDPIAEARVIKTDTASIRLLALQVKADIEAGRFCPNIEEKEQLEQLLEPKFLCFKQYVELARSISSYGTVVVKGVKLLKNVRLKTLTMKKGNKIDIACESKRMVIITESKELRIPWRKVRRWTQASDNVTMAYEIYIMEEKAFTWIEVETKQAAYLLQVTSELVGRLNDRLQDAEEKRPRLAQSAAPSKTKLTWKLFKEEVFGTGKNKDEEFSFYNLEDIESSSEDDDVVIANQGTKPPKLGKKAGAYILQA